MSAAERFTVVRKIEEPGTFFNVDIESIILFALPRVFVLPALLHDFDPNFVRHCSRVFICCSVGCRIFEPGPNAAYIVSIESHEPPALMLGQMAPFAIERIVV
jgi:hypothetical protein